MEFNSDRIQTRAGIDAAGGPASRPANDTKPMGSWEETAEAPVEAIEIRFIVADATDTELAELVRLQLAMKNGETIDRADRRKTLVGMPAQQAA